MKLGILGIKFVDGLTEEEISDLVSEFYQKNRKSILGAEYLEFEDPDTLHKIYAFFSSLRQSKEPVSTILMGKET